MNDSEWSNILSGALMLAYWVAGMFFIRFWRKTADRLFLMFGIAFWVLLIERVMLHLTDRDGESRPYVYFVRLIAFIIIIVAIVDKNRKSRS